MELFSIFASIGLKDDNFSKGIDNATEKGKSFGSIIGDAFGKVNDTANKAVEYIAKGVATAATALYGLGTAAVKMGMDYESAMSQVAATMGITADKSDASFKILSDAAQEAGATTQFSATQAAEALNYLALAGYSAEKSADALPTVLNLAAAGGLDLAYASDLVTDSMSALGIGTNELEGFVDELAKTSQKSNTSVGQLGEAILTVGGTAKTMAGGTNELNTVLGLLADNGIKGAEGGTKLRNVILSLSAPTDTASAALKSLGIEAFDIDGNMKPLQETFGDLNDAMGDMTSQEKAELLNTVFNKQDLSAINALLGTTGERWDELSGLIDEADGAAQQMANTMIDNLAGSITILKSGLEGLAIQFYESIDNPLKDVAQKGIGYVGELSEAMAEGGLSAAVAKLGDIIADAAVYIAEQIPVFIQTGLNLINALVEGLTSNSDAILGSAMTAFNTLIDGINDLLPNLIPLALDILTAFAEGFIKYEEFIYTTGVDIFTQLLEGITKRLPDLIPKAQQAIMNIVKGLSENLPKILNSAIEIVSELANGIAGMLPELIPIAINAILTLVETLIDNVDMLIDSAIAIVIGLAEGIINALPILIEKAPVIIEKLITAIVNNVPKLLKAAWEIVTKLATGIIDNLPEIGKSAGRIIGTIVQGVKDLLTDVKNVGKNIIEGFWNGISDAGGWLREKISGFFGGVVDNIKEFFGIKSPSTLVRDEIGKNLVLGLADGIDKNADKAEKSAENMTKDTLIGAIAGADILAFKELGGEVVSEFIVGFSSGLDTMGGELERVINTTFTENVVRASESIITTFRERIPNMIKAGYELFTSLIEKLPEIIEKITSAVPEIVESIGEKFKEYYEDFKEMGVAVGNQIADGIKEALAGLDIESLAGAGAGGGTDDIGLAAPGGTFARVTTGLTGMEAGAAFAKYVQSTLSGAPIRITQNIQSVPQTASELADATAAAFQTARWNM